MQLIAIAELSRLPNLLLLAGIQVLVFWHLIDHKASGHIAWLSGYPWLIILMTGCGAAAGYVLNDISDSAADALNKRRNPLVLRRISMVSARRLYAGYLFAGTMGSIILGVYWSAWFIPLWICMSLLLWWYSARLQRMPLAGNLLVSLLCAIAVLLTWVPTHTWQSVPPALWWLAGYAGVVTLIREIVKDLEDREGDAAVGDRTLPLVAGEQTSRIVAITVLLVVIFLFCINSVCQNRIPTLLFLCRVFTLVVLIGSILFLTKSHGTASHYHRISLLLKLAMFTGALSLML
jgi:4-hydroxybenzoate polyprenyltransferase